MSVTEVRDPTLCPFAWGGTAFPTGAVPWHPLTSSWCSLPTRLAPTLGPDAVQEGPQGVGAHGSWSRADIGGTPARLRWSGLWAVRPWGVKFRRARRG